VKGPDGGVLTTPDGGVVKKAINEGFTDHFILVVGYDMARTDAGWQVTSLTALDSATADATKGVDQLVVTDSSVTKPAVDGGTGAISMEYQLTQIRIYQKDLASCQDAGAWHR
jgi:hypothetical protein